MVVIDADNSLGFRSPQQFEQRFKLPPLKRRPNFLDFGESVGFDLEFHGVGGGVLDKGVTRPEFQGPRYITDTEHDWTTESTGRAGKPLEKCRFALVFRLHRGCGQDDVRIQPLGHPVRHNLERTLGLRSLEGYRRASTGIGSGPV